MADENLSDVNDKLDSELPTMDVQSPESLMTEPEIQIQEPEIQIQDPVQEETGTKEPEAKDPRAKDAEKKPEEPEPENLVVEGYEFLSLEDAKKAKLDKQKIDILGKKVHSTKVSDLEAVYEKAISNKIFSTPVGWYYLAKLRDRLYAAGVKEEDLIPIPINLKITDVKLKDEYHPMQYITPPPPKKKKDVRAVVVVLIAMNLILLSMVVAMFVIAMKSETDNIINYKQNVTNRFAEWEQSLKEREKAVRIKERDLRIQDDTPYLEEMGISESELTDSDKELEKGSDSD